MAKAKKGSKMSPALKAFLKKYGRFPKKGELRTRVLKAKTAKKGGKGKMTKKKNKGGARRQGVVSWLTSLIQIGTVVANPIARVYEATKWPVGERLNKLSRSLLSDYTGIGMDSTWTYTGWVPTRMIRGYGLPVAGYAFRKGTAYFMKGVKFQLIPKLR